MDRPTGAVRDNKQFFDCFVDFKGYVDFFFLQDAVDEDCNTILYLEYLGRPKSVEDYDSFMAKEMDSSGKGIGG